MSDGAVSKTINLPSDITPEQLDVLLREFLRDLKGCTVYRENSREGQIYQKMTEAETLAEIKKETSTSVLTPEDAECKGFCGISS